MTDGGLVTITPQGCHLTQTRIQNPVRKNKKLTYRHTTSLQKRVCHYHKVRVSNVNS